MDNTTDYESGIKGNNTFTTNSTAGFQSSEYTAASMLWKVCSPCILLLGGFGNIATICVMCRFKDRNSTQHIVLMALAVSDLLSLYSGLLCQWLNCLFHMDLRDLHSLTCKIISWLMYSCASVSAWLLISVTIQRTMAVKYPHKMRMVCSSRRTWIVIAAVILVACIIHFHFVLGMDVSKENECTIRSTWYGYFTRIWAWVDISLSCLFPATCLLVCNGLLSFTLFKSISASTSMTVYVTSICNNDKRRKTASRTTIMILVLSFTFLVLSLPLYIYLIWNGYGNGHAAPGSQAISFDDPGSAVTCLMFYTNSAVNFLLYCLTGNKFRTEFFKWIGRRHQDNSIAS